MDSPAHLRDENCKIDSKGRVFQDKHHKKYRNLPDDEKLRTLLTKLQIYQGLFTDMLRDICLVYYMETFLPKAVRPVHSRMFEFKES